MVFQKIKAVMHRIIPLYAKWGHELMSHFVISEGRDKAEDVKGFSLDGYTCRAGLASYTGWVFSR